LHWVFLSGARRENDQQQSFPQEPRHQLGFAADELPSEEVHGVWVFEDLHDFLVYLERAVEAARHLGEVFDYLQYRGGFKNRENNDAERP